MEPVSQKWRSAQRQIIVPQSFIEINFRIGNPAGQSSGVVADNGAEFFSNPQEIVEETADPVKYAMLEPGLWVLDGSHRLVGGPITPPQFIGSELITLDGFTLKTSDGYILTARQERINDYAG